MFKNPRTKITAAVCGALIVVIAALVVLAQTDGSDLLGTTQVQIIPSRADILTGINYTLSMNGAKKCTWSDSAKMLTFSNGAKGDLIQIQAANPGRTNVTAKCDGKTGVGLVIASNPPTPVPTKAHLSITPFNPRIHPSGENQQGILFKAVNASGGCQWSTSPSGKSGWALVDGGYKIILGSNSVGTYTITAQCGDETATSVLEFTNMMP